MMAAKSKKSDDVKPIVWVLPNETLESRLVTLLTRRGLSIADACGLESDANLNDCAAAICRQFKSKDLNDDVWAKFISSLER